MEDLRPPDSIKRMDAGLATLAMLIQNQRVKTFTFDKHASEVSIVEENDETFINIDILHINSNFSLFYKVLSRPNLFRDEGAGAVVIEDMNMTFKLKPVNE